MNKEKRLSWLGVIACCCLLSACAGQLVCEPEEITVVPEPVVEEPIAVISAEPATPAKPTSTFIPSDTGAGKIPVDERGNPVQPNVAFAFDDAALNASTRNVLQEHARLLREYSDQRVMVEGHCDERGSREYNLALGERRANAVVDFFLANGVRAGQIDSRSFGEERPIDPGSSESAWAKNRRVELKYY
ncbi:MAG: peptidoglycan-associated lipoprotein Pal [Gammaproteobacteria bacterium]|nr:peptidoglycan-associated lipoprotein Pal [Gammaproteobacteria bacterium]